MRHIVLDKAIGQTPLQAIEAWKHAHPRYADTPATYAGRLDPMAEGKLLVLLGDECKRQDRYRGLDKEYEIEVLLDLATDTGDVLGMPAYVGTETLPAESTVQKALRKEVGTKHVPYPAFSSKTVSGKPLFLYALEGALDTIAIPTHSETIHAIRLLGMERVDSETLRTSIASLLEYAPRAEGARSKELGADFRQDAIREAWDALLAAIPLRDFSVLRLRVTCGSGAYMRSLAERIGKTFGTRGMALSIRRTRIGRLRRIYGLRFWTCWY